MALQKCPYMTAFCPHYRTDCDDSASKDCHYIKRTTASMVTAVASLRMVNIESLSPAMLKYLREMEVFLKKMDMPIMSLSGPKEQGLLPNR